MRWGQLRQNDRILCPRDGVEERVVRTQRNGAAVFVRTDRHDHHKTATDDVELAPKKETS